MVRLRKCLFVLPMEMIKSIKIWFIFNQNEVVGGVLNLVSLVDRIAKKSRTFVP